MFRSTKIILIFFFTISKTLWALYSGNPLDPALIEIGFFQRSDKWYGYEFSYNIDTVLDKSAQVKILNNDKSIRFSSLKTRKSTGQVIFNIVDTFEINLGAGAFDLDFSLIPEREKLVRCVMKSSLVLDFGASAILASWNHNHLGLQGRVSTSKSSIKNLEINSEPILNSGIKVSYHEWQAGLGISRQIELLSSYIGLAYTSISGSIQNPPQGLGLELNSIAEKNPFLLFMGMGFSSYEKIAFNIEVRSIAETALTLSAKIRF